MPAGNTYEAIATQTLGSAAASVTFSSIPGTYTDLVLVTNLLGATGGTTDFSTLLQLNGDTGSNYSTTRLEGNGTTATSTRNSSQTFARINTVGYLSTTVPQTNIIQFNNYSNTTTNKTFLTRSSQANEVTLASVNLWRSTSAITSIYFYLSGGTMAAGSTFSLYGILAA